MEEYGYLSILPPIIAIIIALKTREVYISLLFGIILGGMIISDFNILDGLTKSVSIIINVFANAGNTRTIVFSAMIGGLIILIQSSGGVEGFVLQIEKRLKTFSKSSKISKSVLIQLAAIFTGTLIFIETNISLLTTGTVFRPLFDKLKIPREKLAYIADSSSAPISVLIPFNAWGAYITGLIAAEGLSNSFGIMISTLPFNFYALFALLILVLTTVYNKNIGSMKSAFTRAETSGKLFNDASKPMVASEITSTKSNKETPKRAVNMLLPLLVMVLSMPIYLVYTGWDAVNVEPEFFTQISNAISNSSGSSAVLYSVTTAIFFASILYKLQDILKFRQISELTLKGMSGMLPLALLMLLAFAIGDVCRELKTGFYLAEISKSWLSPTFLPVILFLLSGIISFSTGTSWGTFAIMISIAIPTATNLNADVTLSIAAVLSGGVFGDHCSPISDTTIVASMASACDHIDHVKTQLPYALIAALLASISFILLAL